MMILKIGTTFRRNDMAYEITGQGRDQNYLKLLGDKTYITEMHVDTFNMLYEDGQITKIKIPK